MILTVILGIIAAALYDLFKIAFIKAKKKLSGRTKQMIILLWIIMHSLTTIAAAAILVVFHFKGFGEYQVMLDLLMFFIFVSQICFSVILRVLYRVLDELNSINEVRGKNADKHNKKNITE